MQKYRVRITCDETVIIEGGDEEQATEEAWERIMDYGHYGVEIEELDAEVGETDEGAIQFEG